MKECKRADNIPANHNALIKPDLKASTVVIKTCDSITEIIDNFNKMHSKSLNKKKIKRSKHKIAVIGSVAIITLSFCFVKSLKYWK